ncbi:MAG: hypothetical protein ACHP84_15940 [Caulobacterales bacterium]
MSGAALAIAVHVVAIVAWIGGVSFVTTVLMPAIRRAHDPSERLGVFLRYENAFAWQARISVAATGLSGLYLVWRLGAWERFTHAEFWWMHAMVLLWLIFAVMLFALEPLVLHRRLAASARTEDAGPAFARMERMHRVLLGLSLVTVFAAAGGAHGLF